MYKKNKYRLLKARKQRIRRRTSGTATQPRLSVFRSLKHISVQVVDDDNGVTLASASTLEAIVRDEMDKVAPMEKAVKIGTLIAERCKAKNIEQLVFDRNGKKYHGVVKKLADAVREAGVKM